MVHPSHPPRNDQGFTLIEMSMVIVIIGLLLGSVMGGRYLLRQTEFKTIGTSLGKFQTAYGQFKLTYGAKPGDMSDAEDYWSTDPNGCPTHSTRVPRKETCNGDGDDTIEVNEDFRAWQQLSDAELITGTFTGITGSGGANNTVANENAPAGKLTGTAFHIQTQAIASGDANMFDVTAAKDAIYFGTQTSTSWPSSPVLVPDEQYQLDRKMDDGNPTTGGIRALKSPLNPSCTTADTAAGIYNLATRTAACSIVYFLK